MTHVTPNITPNQNPDNTKAQHQVHASNFYPKDLLSGNCPVIYGDYNDNVKSSVDETPEADSKLQIDESGTEKLMFSVTACNSFGQMPPRNTYKLPR